MKINKFIALISIVLSVFSIPINSMEKPITEQSKNNIPTLVDIALPYVEDVALDIYKQKDIKAMDEYLKKLPIELYEKVISYMMEADLGCTLSSELFYLFRKAEKIEKKSGFKAVLEYLKKLPEQLYGQVVCCTIDKGHTELFAEGLLKLYQDSPANISVIIDFMDKLNWHSKVDITKWLIFELTYIGFDSIDPMYQISINQENTFYNDYKGTIVDLLILIINTYQDFDFYNCILDELCFLNSNLKRNMTMQIQININMSSNVHDVLYALHSHSIDIYSSNNEQTKKLLQQYFLVSNVEQAQTLLQQCYNNRATYNLIKLNNLKILIINIVESSIKQELSEEEKEVPNKQELEEVGKQLSCLFSKYCEDDSDKQAKIEQKVSNLLKQYEKEFINKVIDFLVITRYIKSEKKEQKHLLFSLIGFLYPNEYKIELRRIFIMLQEKYPKCFELAYCNPLVKNLKLPPIKYISRIQQAVIMNFAQKLIQLLLNNHEKQNNTKILNELYAYYTKCGSKLINETLLSIKMFGTYINLSSEKLTILQNLHDIILKFARENTIDENEFRPAIDGIDNELDQSSSQSDDEESDSDIFS